MNTPRLFQLLDEKHVNLTKNLNEEKVKNSSQHYEPNSPFRSRPESVNNITIV